MKHKITLYIYGCIHRWSILIIVQRNATQSSLFIILQVHSTCFGCQPHPSSGVHKTVSTASGTGHIFCAVSCNSDDGCGWHPKHVEWTCRIINRLLCVASRWANINPLNAEWNPICHLLTLLGAHHILHVSRIRVNIQKYILCQIPGFLY